MATKHESLPGQTLSVLVKASSAINSSLDLENTLRSIAQMAATVMQAEAGSVLLLDSSLRGLAFAAVTDESARILIGQHFDADPGIAGKVVRTGQPVLVTHVQENRPFFCDMDGLPDFIPRGMVAAPLIYQDKVIGVVEVLNRIGQENFTRADLDLIQLFANLAANGAMNARMHHRLMQEKHNLLASMGGDIQIIGHSAGLRAVLDLCARIASSSDTVLILGETGTGKELISRHIHNNSPRHERPFVAINCAALPETLLESELFGHEKGAFAGATARKIGRFELADGGTLFLNEIGDISPSTQIKLLRVLQEREFVRVGGTQTIGCDVRIIAATNRDLSKAIREGRFREDFYHRLNVFPIQMPPLRERREDIPLLAEHFVRSSAKRLNVPVPTVSDDVMALLTSHAWPGNIREFQNVLERAVLLSDGQVLRRGQLPSEITGDAPDPQINTSDSSLWGYEKALILNALKEQGWNQTRAAKALGISRDNLRYRVKKYKIRKPK